MERYKITKKEAYILLAYALLTYGIIVGAACGSPSKSDRSSTVVSEGSLAIRHYRVDEGLYNTDCYVATEGSLGISISCIRH